MEKSKVSTAFILSFIGSILILVNGLWIAVNRAPILLSSSPVLFVEDIPEDVFWGRMALGVKGLVEGMASPFWLIFAIAMLVSAIQIYAKPRRQKQLGFLIIVFSLLSIPIGGGFILGSILGFIGGASGVEWPKPFNDTFFGKIVMAAKLDSRHYRNLVNDPTNMRTAAFVIILINLLSGLGNSLYVYNLNKVKTGVDFEKTAILLQGVILWDNPSIFRAIGYIGVALIKWLILALAIYIVGVKFMAVSSDFDKIARASAFAYAPICLQMFLPLMFSNEPFLSYSWPMSIFFLTNLWMIVGLIVGIKEALDTSTRRALGALTFGGTIYWLINNLFIIPALEVPSINLEIALPESLPTLLVLITFACVFATLLGVFTKK